MALTITHTFVSSKPDGSDTTVVRPSNWNATHTVTGTLSETGLAFTDITTRNATTSLHGLLPKLSGTATQFLNGAGAWVTPAVVESQLSSFTDITTANATSSVHGLLPKLSGSATQYLNGAGAWTTPAGVGVSVDETELSFTDITTNNASTVKHGLLKKLPNDSALFMDGTGNWSTPSGGSSFNLAADHVFTGANEYSVADFGTAGNLLTMSVFGNTNGDASSQISLYVRVDNTSGNIGNGTAILIDSPTVTGHVSTSYGLQIGNQAVGNQDAAFNIYSAGSTSLNFFEGAMCIGSSANPEGAKLHVAGDVRLRDGRLMVGFDPTCDSALMTVYQTMNSGTNSSMVDIVATGGDNMDQMSAMVINARAGGNLGDMIGLYLKNTSASGVIDNSIALKIDASELGEATVNNMYGLLIENQTGGGTANWAIKTGTGLVEFGDKLKITTNGGGGTFYFQDDDGTFQSSNNFGINTTTFAATMDSLGDTIVGLTQNVSISGGSAGGIEIVGHVVDAVAATTFTAVFVDPMVLGSGSTLDTFIGFAVGDQTNATSNWAIKTGLGKVEFGDTMQARRQQSTINVVDNTLTTTPTFDCNLGDLQMMTVTRDSVIVATNMLAGQRVTFFFTQDNSGGHHIVWDELIVGGRDIDQTPNAVSIQDFVCGDNSTLVALVPTL